MKVYRQGDVLLRELEGKMPAQATLSDDPVLVRGEATGHSHRVVGKTVQVYRNAEQIFVKGGGELVHEEHDPIVLPQLEDTVLQVVRQREYDPAANRTITD